MLPLFPLQTVLFPGGLLVLQIFEVRYLDMVGRCHKENRPFGVVSLTQGTEVRRLKQGQPSETTGASLFATEAFHAIGTLAHIDQLEPLQAGLLMVRCSGGQRFHLTHHEQLTHGLWVGKSEPLPLDPPVTVPKDLAHVSLAMRQLIHQFEGLAAPGEEMPVRSPYLWDDCGWLANRWCELLPISSALRQQLMVVDSPLLRLELVADLLGDIKGEALMPRD